MQLVHSLSIIQQSTASSNSASQRILPFHCVEALLQLYLAPKHCSVLLLVLLNMTPEDISTRHLSICSASGSSSSSSSRACSILDSNYIDCDSKCDAKPHPDIPWGDPLRKGQPLRKVGGYPNLP